MTAEAKSTSIRTLLLGGGAGAGVALVVALAKAIGAEPKLVIQLLSGWGPLSMLAVVGLVIFDRHQGENLLAQRESAAAMQAMADSIRQIAGKDDLAARERELMLNDIAYTIRLVKEDVAAIKEHQCSAATAAGGRG